MVTDYDRGAGVLLIILTAFGYVPVSLAVLWVVVYVITLLALKALRR